MSEVDFDSYVNEQFSADPVAAESTTDATPAEGETQEQADTRLRDEQGRFAAAPEEEPQELILGKYKTNEDAIKALEHSQSEIGRLGQELGHLRQQVYGPQQTEYDLSDADEVADPALAQAYAVAALQQNDQLAYRKTMASWAELDPFGAMDFHARKIAMDQSAAFQQQIGPVVQHTQMTAQQAATAASLDEMAASREDFTQVVGSIQADEARLAELIETRPGLRSAMQVYAARPSHDSAAALFDTLYSIGKEQQAGQAATATQENDAQTLAQKAQATVASASTSPTNVDTGDGGPHLAIPGFEGSLSDFQKTILAPSSTAWTQRGGQ